MYALVTGVSPSTQLLINAPLTVSLLHYIGNAFTVASNDALAIALYKEFGAAQYAAYCIDHLPAGRAVLTFSTLKNPKVYAYRKSTARIREPDLSMTLYIKEVSVVKPPTLLTTKKVGYIA